MTLNLTLRLIGIGLALLTALWLEPGRFDVFNGLVLPLTMAAGAYLACRNWVVVLLVVGALALGATETSSDNWIQSLAYPGLAIASGVGLAVILWQRWQQRIADTHEARWAERQQRRNQDNEHNDGQ